MSTTPTGVSLPSQSSRHVELVSRTPDVSDTVVPSQQPHSGLPPAVRRSRWLPQWLSPNRSAAPPGPWGTLHTPLLSHALEYLGPSMPAALRVSSHWAGAGRQAMRRWLRH